MEYADYHHAMAQHAAALSNNNQLHPAMAQIPMLSAAGLNLTVMSGGLGQGQQHHLGQMHTGQHVMYQNVQTQQVAHHQQTQQQQPQQQQNHGNHHNTQQSHGGHGGGGGGGNQSPRPSSNSKKNKQKPKVNKDGVPAPKRATTAYINFTQWYREELKKAGRPIPKIGDFGKECAGKWNAMQEDEKKPFLEVAERDRDRYKREMAIYKPARDANKPKRPGTAFMLFMGDFRKEMAGKEPEGGVAALAKLGGERWRGMTEEDKRPYVERQNEEKVKYEVRMEDYRKMGTAGGPARLSTEGSEPDATVNAGSGHDSDNSGTADRSSASPASTTAGQQQQVTYAQFTTFTTPTSGTTTSTAQQPPPNNALTVAYQQAVGSPTSGTQAQLVYAPATYTWQ